MLDRALQKEQLAADATSPKARARALKDAIRAVIGFVHRLGSQAARHHVSANTRQMLRQLAVGLHTDLVGLRSKS